MIKLAFVGSQRKIIRFEITGGYVTYYDDMWKQGVRIYPKDQDLIEKLRRSGKPNLKMMAALILDANKGQDLKDYENCQDDENRIADIIIKDCESKGLMQIK